VEIVAGVHYSRIWALLSRKFRAIHFRVVAEQELPVQISLAVIQGRMLFLPRQFAKSNRYYKMKKVTNCTKMEARMGWRFLTWKTPLTTP